MNSTMLVAYADVSTIRKVGDVVRMTGLFDWKEPRSGPGGRFVSEYLHDEFDCQRRAYRTVADTLFSESMAQGRVVYVGDIPAPWRPVQPRTVADGLWQVACGAAAGVLDT